MQSPDDSFNITIGTASSGATRWAETSGQTSGPSYRATDGSTPFDKRLRVVEQRLDGFEKDVHIMRVELQAEIRDVLAAFREGEASRKEAYSSLTGEIGKLTSSLEATEGKLPSKDTIRNYALGIIGTIVATIIGIVALWGDGFGAGAAIEDQVTTTAVEQARLDSQQDARLDRVLDAVEKLTDDSRDSGER